jgi:hypothetical protein
VSALHGERYTRFFWNVLVFMMGVLGSPKLYHVTSHAERDITVLDSKTGSVTLGYRPS